MTDKRDVDRLVESVRDYVRALMDQGQIDGHSHVTTAQAGLRDALRAAFGLKESAQ
jgi:hypothetical protein